EWVTCNPIPPGRSTLVERTALTARTVHLPDCLADPEYTYAESQKRGGYRTMLGVPLLRDGTPLGVIALTRSQVRPFTDKQIELVSTFADQAVIAIENVRLFDETKEALERQTATAEILRVISSSPTDTQPVFEAIVQSGLRLFANAGIMIALPDGDLVRAAAVAASEQADAEAIRRRSPIPLTREYMTGIAILDRRVVDISDAENAPSDLATGARNFLATGYRAITIVPMMLGDVAIGALSVLRRRPGPLSGTQLALLKTFAEQAAIAIENVRLLNDLRQRTEDLTEALEQQMATADLLKVISRSTFDLQRVFTALTASATRLCQADAALIWRLDGASFHLAATSEIHEEFSKFAIEHPPALNRRTASGRCVLERRAVHILDVREDPEYDWGEGQKIGVFRTMLGVPLLRREGAPLGAFALWRRIVRPFTDKQIELVTTFASQAVIAIENTR